MKKIYIKNIKKKKIGIITFAPACAPINDECTYNGQ